MKKSKKVIEEIEENIENEKIEILIAPENEEDEVFGVIGFETIEEVNEDATDKNE